MIDSQQARRAMVDTQVRPSDVTRYAIIEAMLEIPREQYLRCLEAALEVEARF